MKSGANPKVGGLLEAALYVEDLQRSKQFYQTIFDFETLYSNAGCCAMSVGGQQALLLFEKGASIQPIVTSGGIIPPSEGSGSLHLAFSISAADVESWEKKLIENGVEIESKVEWKQGGRSLYFRDPDHHLIELVTPGCWSIY